MSAVPIEIAELKSRLKATWSAGDYGVVAQNLESSAKEFLSRIPIDQNSRVLDVACGTGQIAFPAHQAGASVVGIDIAPNLIDQARARAITENCDIQFDVGDAEALPYQDKEFDLVITLIGAMFAPRPVLAASEMKRVCKPGGKIIMGNWTPEGFIGKMFKIVSKYVPPSPLMESPLKWGQDEVVKERLKDDIKELKLSRRMYPFHYPYDAFQVVEMYREYFGPINRAFHILNEKGQKNLHEELEHLWKSHSTANNENEVTVNAEILEVIAVKK